MQRYSIFHFIVKYLARKTCITCFKLLILFKIIVIRPCTLCRAASVVSIKPKSLITTGRKYVHIIELAEHEMSSFNACNPSFVPCSLDCESRVFFCAKYFFFAPKAKRLQKINFESTEYGFRLIWIVLNSSIASVLSTARFYVSCCSNVRCVTSSLAIDIENVSKRVLSLFIARTMIFFRHFGHSNAVLYCLVTLNQGWGCNKKTES